MVDIPKPKLKHVNNICIKVLTSQNKPVKTLVALSLYETTQKLRIKIRLIGSFNWIQSHQKILMKNTNKTRTENSARENIDLFIQKKSEADNRLIDYQDNTPTHNILKTGDLVTEKTKNQKNLVVGLSGFICCKGNSDVAQKILSQIIFCTNNSRKRF